MAYPPVEKRPAAPIRKSNAFARAGYSLSLGGHRLVGCALASLTADPSQFPHVAISSELMKTVFPRLQSQNAFAAQMHKATADASAMKVRLFDDDFANIAVVSVFTRVDFIAGTFLFSFNPDLKPQVVELTKHYTQMTLGDLGDLSSEFQFRLLEIVRSFMFRGSQEITIENLRKALDIGPDLYPSAGHFMARVIKPSVEAINEKTRLSICVEPIKHSSSHKILSVKFTVEDKGTRKLTAEDRRLMAGMQELKVNQSRAFELVMQYDSASIEEALQHVKARAADGAISNPAGLFITKLTGGTRAQQSIAALQPKWTQNCEAALSLYRSKSQAERRQIDRDFMAWAADPWQMFGYIELFQKHGIEHPFTSQLMALYVHATRQGKAPKPDAKTSAQLALASAAGQVDLFA